MLLPALFPFLLVVGNLIPESTQMSIFNDQASSENFVNSIYKDEEDSSEDGLTAQSSQASKPLSPKVIFPSTASLSPFNINRPLKKETKQQPLGFLDSWLKKVPTGLLKEAQKNPPSAVKRLVLKRKMKVLPTAGSQQSDFQTIQKISCACNCSTAYSISPNVMETTTAQQTKPVTQISPVKPIVQPPPPPKTKSFTLSSFTCHSSTIAVPELPQTTSITSVPEKISTSTFISTLGSNAVCTTLEAGSCICPKAQVSQQITVEKGKQEKIHIKAEKPNEHVPLMEKEMCKVLFQHDQASKEIERTSHEEMVDMQETHFLPVMRGLFLSFMHIVSQSVDKIVSKHDRKILKAQCEILKHALPQTYVDTKIIKQTYTTFSVYSVTIPQHIQCITYDTRTLTMTVAPTTSVFDEDTISITPGGKVPMITVIQAGGCVPCCVPCCTSQISNATTTIAATKA